MLLLKFPKYYFVEFTLSFIAWKAGALPSFKELHKLMICIPLLGNIIPPGLNKLNVEFS
jgi:hypothetical protein